MKERSLPEPTIHDVLDTIHDVLGAINEFATRIEQRLDTHDLQFEQLRAEMNGVQSKMTDMATKEDLTELKSEIISEIDHFVVLHQKKSGRSWLCNHGVDGLRRLWG